jgi:Zinc knuckle
LNAIFSYLIDEARRLKSQEPQEMAMNTIAKRTHKKGAIKCFKCGKKGHYAKECHSKPSKPSEAESEAEAEFESAGIAL